MTFRDIEFEQSLSSHKKDLTPVGAIEDELVLQIHDAAWNLRHLRIREAQLMTECPDPLANPNCAAQLVRLDRLRRSNECSYHRALKELLKLKADRPACFIAMEQTSGDGIPRLVNPNRSRHKTSRDANIPFGPKLLTYKTNRRKRNEPTSTP